MKRLVICLDGTWNNAASERKRDDGTRVYKPTNVLKVARATCQFDDCDHLQVTYYDAGVGAMNRAPNLRTKIVRFFDNKLGGGWGAGFEVNIEEAYTFLANNYARGDEIFVFGFSRGAAQARSLVRFIEWTGGFPTKEDAYYVPMLFTRFLERRGEGSGQELWDERNARRENQGRSKLRPIESARIRFLGVWDTVLAMGLRLKARGGSSAAQHRFHAPNQPLPTIVDRVRHALAIDERRHDFQPEIWNSDGASEEVEQRWFPGVHSNIGGGLLDDGLANGALCWLCEEAAGAGLKLNAEFLKYYESWPLDQSSNKATIYKIGDFILRPFRGFGGIRNLTAVPGMTLDTTVFARLNAEPTEDNRLGKSYRPKNLLVFLAANPQHDGELDPQALAEVQKLR